MRVFVYRNLTRKGNIFSIKSLEGPTKGRVIAHAHGIHLEKCELVVSQAGRNRVLKQQRRNVHAGIVGDLVGVAGYEVRIHNTTLTKAIKQYSDKQWLKTFQAGISVTYNPYYYKTFVVKGSKIPVLKAKAITFFHERVEILEK